jgi:hypothetical protein
VGNAQLLLALQQYLNSDYCTAMNMPHRYDDPYVHINNLYTEIRVLWE